MPRKARELVEGGIYHVFNRGNDRRDLFREGDDFDFFREALHQAKDKFPIEIFHYCLMNNHFHLLVRLLKGEDLPQFMHALQLHYARFFKKKYKSVGHVFQERFRSPRIPEESYYLQCGRYIERNPLKAGLVSEAAQYPYSSAPYYVRGVKDTLITPNIYYEEMGKTHEERRENYRQFLLLDEPYSSMVDQALVKV